MVKFNKKELATSIAENNDITKKEAIKIVDEVFDCIKQHVKEDGSVDIIGFGKFVLKHKDAKEAINPKTKEKIVSKEKYSVAFKPSQIFKDELQ